MEEKIRISILLEIYGKLLTTKQNEFMDNYYNQDLSLSEIADNNEITRQAVSAILVKCKEKLEQYEKDLKILEKQQIIKKQIEKLENTKITTEQSKILDKIKSQFDF